MILNITMFRTYFAGSDALTSLKSDWISNKVENPEIEAADMPEGLWMWIKWKKPLLLQFINSFWRKTIIIDFTLIQFKAVMKILYPGNMCSG